MGCAQVISSRSNGSVDQAGYSAVTMMASEVSL
jgi:hypothetical protein